MSMVVRRAMVVLLGVAVGTSQLYDINRGRSSAIFRLSYDVADLR
jgi:hypothetical protein